jgi:hypothetical protein
LTVALRHAQAARIAFFEWLQTWYSLRRRRSALDYLAPLELERQVAAAGRYAIRPCYINPRKRREDVDGLIDAAARGWQTNALS